jgi:hypothetical protein
MIVTETSDTNPVALEISLQNGSLLCGQAGGHIRGLPGVRVQWASNQDFTLEFFRLAEEPVSGVPVSQDSPRWPFSEPRLEDVKWPLQKFEGVLREDPSHCPSVYKYYITVGNLRLDPIVIIDRLR